MSELFFGEALRATSHRPHCRRHDDSLPEAIDQTIAFINQYVERWRLSGSAWLSDRPRCRVTTIWPRSITATDPVMWGTRTQPGSTLVARVRRSTRDATRPEHVWHERTLVLAPSRRPGARNRP
jgi:hypothetical protein